MSADVRTMMESPTSAGVSVIIYSHVGWGINYISNHYPLADLIVQGGIGNWCDKEIRQDVTSLWGCKVTRRECGVICGSKVNGSECSGSDEGGAAQER